jgi:two-component system response regulator MtrA
VVETQAASVLVVDDDPRMRHLLEVVLKNAGYNVVLAGDGEQAVRAVRRICPDLVLMDLLLPRAPGLEVLRAVRAADDALGIIILTAAAEHDLMVDALEAGADDYLVKPFVPRVLVARVRAVLRRAARPVAQPTAGERVGAVALDPMTQHACLNGRRVALTPTEFALLRTLMRGVGRVFSSDDLLSRVWGPSYLGQDDIIRANIYRLRRKLERVPSQPQLILGRRGVGYYFNPGGD